jgi:hypothetical protein
MRLRPVLAGAAAAVVLLVLSTGVIGQTSIVSAAGPTPVSVTGPPRNAHHFPLVPGVNGSTSSINDMNIDLGDKIQMVENEAPVTAALADMGITEYRLSRNNRNYVQISGRYCKNKTGGDVFVADGAPIDPGLNCGAS